MHHRLCVLNVLTGSGASIALHQLSWERRTRSRNAMDTVIEGEQARENHGPKGRMGDPEQDGHNADQNHLLADREPGSPRVHAMPSTSNRRFIRLRPTPPGKSQHEIPVYAPPPGGGTRGTLRL